MNKNVIGENQFENVIQVEKKDNFQMKAGIFLAGVAGMSTIIGFGATFAAAKKTDPKYFNEGIMPTQNLSESGVRLALRALGWGSFFAWTGCGLLFYGIWKVSGAKNFQEFRYKMGSILPAIPKNDPQQGRTEFTGMNDLLEYLQHMKSAKDK